MFIGLGNVSLGTVNEQISICSDRVEGLVNVQKCFLPVPPILLGIF